MSDIQLTRMLVTNTISNNTKSQTTLLNAHPSVMQHIAGREDFKDVERNSSILDAKVQSRSYSRACSMIRTETS